MVFINSQSVNSEIGRQQGLAREIARMQTQISSGKKYDVPSDNPQDWIQISTIGRQQQLAKSWNDNLTYGASRATQAASSLDDVNNLMNQMTELLVTSTSNSAASPGNEAVAQKLEGIKATIQSIMTQKDYQGTPTFDDMTTNAIPIGVGLTVEAVGTRQSIETGIPTAGGPKSIYAILDSAITAVRTGNQTAQGVSLAEGRVAVNHVIVARSQQAVRSQRIEDEKDRLSSTTINLAERRSNLEDTDLSSLVAALTSKLTTLQAAQAAFVKINSQTLFDLIR